MIYLGIYCEKEIKRITESKDITTYQFIANKKCFLNTTFSIDNLNFFFTIKIPLKNVKSFIFYVFQKSFTPSKYKKCYDKNHFYQKNKFTMNMKLR